MMLYLTAFLTGLLGSFHCAGMCGPIAFALPGKSQDGRFYYAGRLLYNGGRILTYAFLGLISGAFGFGLKLAGWQQGISIGVGVFILLYIVYSRIFKRSSGINPFNLFSGSLLKKLFGSKKIYSFFLIGLINGFLPCGFVYMAIMGASVTQDIISGALFMVCFGLGTFPMMLGVSVAGQFLSAQVRSRFNKLSPVFAVIIALLFIIRGLNLGIPYLSPQLQNTDTQIENCE